jgi:hypothetical protein
MAWLQGPNLPRRYEDRQSMVAGKLGEARTSSANRAMARAMTWTSIGVTDWGSADRTPATAYTYPSGLPCTSVTRSLLGVCSTRHGGGRRDSRECWSLPRMWRGRRGGRPDAWSNHKRSALPQRWRESQIANEPGPIMVTDVLTAHLVARFLCEFDRRWGYVRSLGST